MCRHGNTETRKGEREKKVVVVVVRRASGGSEGEI